MATKKNAPLRPLVMGNWKMNPASLDKARALFSSIHRGLKRAPHLIDVVVAPPFPFIFDQRKISSKRRIALAAQSVSQYSEGAHTGEVSAKMLKSVGVTSVIVGHSERRAAGISDDEVELRLQAIVKEGLTAVLCIGEKKRDSKGDYFTVVEEQFKKATNLFPKSKLSKLVIAYEPIWAIGTGKTASPGDALEMKLFIQKLIADRFGRGALRQIRVLYGGSVKAANADELLREGGVDGFLIGGASLKPEEFVSIVKIAETYAKERAT